MKQKLLLSINTIFLFLIITSCGDDDEPEVNPIVGLWKLNNVEIDAQGVEFDYLDQTTENELSQNNLVGERNFTMEFNTDFTFERILEDVTFTNGSRRNINETGEWELEGDDLDLFLDGQEINGLPYSFDLEENTDSDLILTYSETGSAFPQSKIDEWFADGTINNETRTFTVTDEQFDSLVTNFAQNVVLDHSLELKKQ